jgi:hypothetical protein
MRGPGRKLGPETGDAHRALCGRPAAVDGALYLIMTVMAVIFDLRDVNYNGLLHLFLPLCNRQISVPVRVREYTHEVIGNALWERLPQLPLGYPLCTVHKVTGSFEADLNARLGCPGKLEFTFRDHSTIVVERIHFWQELIPSAQWRFSTLEQDRHHATVRVDWCRLSLRRDERQPEEPIEIAQFIYELGEVATPKARFNSEGGFSLPD